MILLLFGNATAHKVGVSLASFKICLSSVVFAWSCRPTCPRSLNIVGHKKKSQGPFELHCGKSNQAPSKRASDPPKEKKRLLAPFSKDSYWLRDLRAPSALWPTGGFGLLQYGATICWKNKKAMQTCVEASGSNCWLGFGLRARPVVIGSLFA